jgi:hypothetical protein
MMSQNDPGVSGRPRAQTQLQYLKNMEKPSTASNTRLDENVESSEAEALTNQKVTYEDVERVRIFFYFFFGFYYQQNVMKLFSGTS